MHPLVFSLNIIDFYGKFNLKKLTSTVLLKMPHGKTTSIEIISIQIKTRERIINILRILVMRIK